MNESVFKKGFQIWNLPLSKEIWQLTLFAIGYEYWTEDDEDHDAYQQVTWYVQLLFWQFSFTRELI